MDRATARMLIESLTRDAERIARHFGLRFKSIRAERANVTSRYGVCYADGEIKIRLNWEKRYITLAARSTLLGLAFKLRDPDNLLGHGPEPGISAALVPSNLPGITLGRQHDPLNVPFFNCPFEGKDVLVDVDTLVGGAARAGQGWRMLMEQLAAGRGIMLPAQATAGTAWAARVTSAYSVVRKQFGMSIGRFEGIAEPMARIGASTYALEAARRFTCGGLDQGAKPAVASAIVSTTPWTFAVVRESPVAHATCWRMPTSPRRFRSRWKGPTS